jgi:hypothetical protein
MTRKIEVWIYPSDKRRKPRLYAINALTVGRPAMEFFAQMFRLSEKHRAKNKPKFVYTGKTPLPR